MKRLYDLIIVGGGPGGYTAALYAARAGLRVVVLEKLSAGGQMAQTAQVDNYPGFPQGIDGFELAERMQEQAERFGAESELAEVYAMDLKANPKRLDTSEGTFYAKAVIIATGAGPKKLGLPREEALTGRGVNYCAACDGMFYRGKTVVIVGGGNSAVSEAMILSRIAKKVILVHRRDSLRATKVYLEPLQKLSNLEFVWNSRVSGLIGDKRLEAVEIENLLSGDKSIFEADGLFVSIGRSPSTELVKGQLELDNGYIIADESCRTNLPGVFAIGDVRTKALRQILTAAADGANAVHYAEEYLAGLNS